MDIETTETTKNKKNTKAQKRKFTLWFWSLFISIILFLFLFFYGVAAQWFGPMPSFEELENPKSNLASEIYSSDGELLGKFYIENRSNVHYKNLSPYLINALIATEDARFIEHNGIDGRSLLRVAYGVPYKIFTGKNLGGGSTITQQLAKNLFPRGRMSTMDLVMRKFKEWVTAIKLERNYTKEEIIAMYFNTIDFGSLSFGIKSASRTFFNSTPDSLNMQEAALFVAILNAPTRYSPVRNPENALRRRNLVINQMYKYDYITKDVCDSVKQLPIDLSEYGIQDHNSGLARYFREYLRSYMKKWCKETTKLDGTHYNLYKDGIKIYTTIDSRMQKYAEQAIQDHLGKDLQPTFYRANRGYTNAPFVDLTNKQVEKVLDNAMKRSERYRKLRRQEVSYDSIKKNFDTPVSMRVFSWEGEIDTILSPRDSLRYYAYLLRAGLMSMDPQSGQVRAYVGGIDYKYFKFDHVRQGRRQVGSTFKPFVYTMAIQEGGFTPCSEVPNLQVSFDLPDGTRWEPRNSTEKNQGEMVSIKWALAHSVNWVSAYLMKQTSPQAVIKLARKMGVTSPIPAVPSICLGVSDISLYEMVGAFNTFGNKGIYVEPTLVTRIEDKYGNVIENFTPKRNEAINEETAWLMLKTMEGVVQYGTSRRLRYKYGFTHPIAGKTGTTQNQSDGWFMGITPQLTTGIWVGGEVRSVHFRTITYGQGSNMALPIWALYMQKVYNDPTLNITKEDFEAPSQSLQTEFDCDKYNALPKSLIETEVIEEF